MQSEDPPGFALWIVLFEMREEVVIGEMEQAGGVVGHDVRLPWDEEAL